MAQRVLNTNFWTDNWVEELEPTEKLVFIYLITNPLNNLAWAYKISIKRISYETGLEENEIIQILQKFQDAGKIVKYENWIVIVNFIKNQSKNPKIELGIKRIVSELPKALIYAVYDSLCIAYAYPMYSLSHFTLLNFTLLNYIDFNISSLRSEILKQPSAGNFLENKKNCKNPQSSSEDTPKGGETVGNDLDFSLKNFSENTEKTEENTSEEDLKNSAAATLKNKYEYGDEAINAIIQAIIDFHGTSDGTQSEQRKYGAHLKNKIAKIKGFDGDFYNFITKICEKTSKFHITKTTSPKSLYENLGVLISAIKSQSSQEFQSEKPREITAEDIKTREEKIRARESAEERKRRENDKKIAKEKSERQKILKFFHENLAEEIRNQIEKKTDEKFQNLPVKKWDLTYEIEIVRLTRPYFTA